MELILGDIVKTKSIKAILEPNHIISGGSATFKVTDKKSSFLFLFLGIESVDSGSWEAYEKRMNDLGWYFDPFKLDNGKYWKIK